jgi:lipopolysaccharide export LptBFGC system permease protein LptF
LKLHLYLMRSLVTSFAFALGAIVVLAVPGVAVSAVSRLPGVDTWTLLVFMPLLLSEFVPYVVPVCFLLAVVFTYGRLEADGEWTAIQMSGIHPLRLFAPGLVFALALSGFTLWLLAEELPHICRVQKTFQIEASRTLFQNLSPGRTELQFGKFYLSALSRDGRDFVDVVVTVPTEGGGPLRKFVADRVHFEFRPNAVLVYPTRMHTISGQFDLRSSDPVIYIDLKQMQESTDRALGSMRYHESSQLQSMLDAGAFEPARKDAVRYEIRQRRASASICVVFLLLGIPTGLRLWRRRQLVAVAASVGYALVYYVLSMRLGHVLVDHHLLTPDRGAWVLPVLGTLIGIDLCRRALNPRGGRA